ncbi:hypothetical protein [Zoogloea sp.]|uniref:hypothetical protein n=1 Tax=Zoogloea sp. TaxID=49181 RepID=UPI0035AF892D
MDWFERLTGFKEQDFAGTQAQLELDGRQLRSRINGRSYGIGELELVSLETLRQRIVPDAGGAGRLKLSVVEGDVRQLHQAPELAGALFQVASQFNLLEMTGPGVTPENGVTRYAGDLTQGPACAMAAGAATIYRNYFVPVGEQIGQRRHRQLDGLADLGVELAVRTGLSREKLWTMQNGYALCSREGLAAISRHLASLDDGRRDALRGLLRIGVHRDVEVTDVDRPVPHRVSQAFCSALPVAYGQAVPKACWADFATLVLEAAYEATLWVAVANAQRGASNVVLLTRLGGGVFGNEGAWIYAAMRRALQRVRDYELDVQLVSFNRPTQEMLQLQSEFG